MEDGLGGREWVCSSVLECFEAGEDFCLDEEPAEGGRLLGESGELLLRHVRREARRGVETGHLQSRANSVLDTGRLDDSVGLGVGSGQHSCRLIVPQRVPLLVRLALLSRGRGLGGRDVLADSTLRSLLLRWLLH